MKILLMVLILFLSPLTVIAPEAEMLKLMLKGILDLAVKYPTLPLPKFALKIPENFNKIAAGILNLTNIRIFELNNAEKNLVDVTKLSPTDVNFTRNNIKIQLSFNNLGLCSAYYLDVGIYYEKLPMDIPLYGDGNFSFGFHNVTLDLELNVEDKNLRDMRVSNLSIKLRFENINTTNTFITGFWKNEVVSKFASDAIVFLDPIIYIIYYYKVECPDCIMSKTAEFIANSILQVKNLRPDIHCSCLQYFPFDMKRTLETVLLILFPPSTGD